MGKHFLTYTAITFVILFIFCDVSSLHSKSLNIKQEIDSVLYKHDKARFLTQHGITWTFDEPVVYGKFVNGDYWVVDQGGGVEIVDISPGHELSSTSGRHINGSMLNPSGLPQGYDSYQNYDVKLNVGVGISSCNPLILKGNVSLVSTISNNNPGIKHKSYVQSAAVLTCLSSPPDGKSFRPGISGSNKTLHKIKSIKFDLLRELSSPTNKPNISKYTEFLQMVWLAHSGSWVSRYMRPTASGMDNYYYARIFSTVALMLHLDYPREQKYRLLVNFIQLGIDLYSYIESGGRGWPPDGGHMSGRKWPILFAGIMLDFRPMKDIGKISGDYINSNGYGPGNLPPNYIHFGEDGQTFFVTEDDVAVTNSDKWNPDMRNENFSPYTFAMVGMPEWSIRYSTAPNRSDSSWTAKYRTIATGPRSWAGFALAAYIMDAKKLWNHDCFFAYVDRYVTISKGNTDPFNYVVPNEQKGGSPTGLIGTMWEKYRPLY